MNKIELTNKLAEKAEITKKDAGEIIDIIIETAIETLTNGEKIDIYGFGKLEVKDVAARQARNPHTGETIDVPKKKAIKFKAAKALKCLING